MKIIKSELYTSMPVCAEVNDEEAAPGRSVLPSLGRAASEPASLSLFGPAERHLQRSVAVRASIEQAHNSLLTYLQCPNELTQTVPQGVIQAVKVNQNKVANIVSLSTDLSDHHAIGLSKTFHILDLEAKRNRAQLETTLQTALGCVTHQLSVQQTAAENNVTMLELHLAAIQDHMDRADIIINANNQVESEANVRLENMQDDILRLANTTDIAQNKQAQELSALDKRIAKAEERIARLNDLFEGNDTIAALLAVIDNF